MGRVVKDVTIELANRDHGKTFRLTEMPASQGEAWAIRALGAMARGGVTIPEEMLSAGWGALAFLGARALLSAPYEEVGPLLVEMMDCIKSVQPAAPEGRVLLESDVEEIGTRLFLRDEVFRLHAGFSLAERLLELTTPLLVDPPPLAAEGSPSQSTPTSTPESELSSAPG